MPTGSTAAEAEGGDGFLWWRQPSVDVVLQRASGYSASVNGNSHGGKDLPHRVTEL